MSWPDSYLCRLSSYLSTSGSRILGGNLDFLFASFAQISNFVSDSSPAKPQSGTRNRRNPRKRRLLRKFYSIADIIRGLR